MTEDYLRGQISAKEDEITKIEEEADNKSAATGKEIEDELNPQINDLKSKLESEQAALDEAIERYNEWKDKMAEQKIKVKNLTSDVKALQKQKDTTLNTKLKEVESEKKSKIKGFRKEINALQKELSALEKAAAKEAAAKGD